jgi:hypothetical protein
MTFIINSLLNQDVITYAIFTGVTGALGYSFISSYFNTVKVDTGVQTNDWEDYSDRPSQIIQDSNSVSSMDTMTPGISPTQHISSQQILSDAGTLTVTEGASSTTTVLPIPPVHIEVLPNPDLQSVLDVNTIYLSKIQELSLLYQRELHDNVMTNSDLAYLIKTFTIEQISSSNFNEYVLLWISCFNG